MASAVVKTKSIIRSFHETFSKNSIIQLHSISGTGDAGAKLNDWISWQMALYGKKKEKNTLTKLKIT